MYDAVKIFGALLETRPVKLPVESGEFVLATIHRQENTDDPLRLRAIFEGLAQVAQTTPVVLPLHPRTRARLDSAGALDLLDALTVTDPIGYLEMVAYGRAACVIATDSGGVQKEAFFHGVPCVTLRDETEWVELVDGGWNRLITPSDPAMVAEAILSAAGTRGADIAPYGDGDASGAIIDAIAALIESS